MIDVVTIGEALATVQSERVGALSVGSPLRLSFAGAESNVAIGLARLGHRVRWAGCVGNDDFGHMVLRSLRGEGVDTSCVRVLDGSTTALLVKHQRFAHVGRITYHRTGTAGSRIDAHLAAAAISDGARVLHVTGITPALSESAADAVIAAVTAARRQGTLVSLDVNYRSALWSRVDAAAALRPLATQAAIVFASEDELDLVTPPGAGTDATSLAGDDRIVVVTRAAEGAAVVTGDGVVEQPAVPVSAVDTVGAGDAFVAGYLSALLDGLDTGRCLRRGCTTAALAVTTHGDWEGLPTLAELSLLEVGTDTTLR